jgi:Right handed beta helix region
MSVPRLLAATAAALAVTASPAAADSVHCGQLITHSIRLGRDLIGCPGDGLVIGADHVTVDLGGHTLGGGNPDAVSDGGRDYTVGVSNPNGYAAMTVEHGTITRFGEAVTGSGGDRAVVRDLTITGNRYHGRYPGGILLDSSSGAIVAGNRLSGSQIALYFMNTSLVAANDVHDGAGIWLAGSTNSRVIANRVHDIGGEHLRGLPLIGIHLFLGGASNTVEGNLLTRTTNEAIALDADEQNPMTDVRVVANIIQDAPDGIIVSGADRTLVGANLVSGAGMFGDPGLDGSGIYIDAPHTLLVANRADRNTGDGINVQNASTTITANIANRNGRHGIEAVAGAVDGGGNHAAGNAVPPECTGVSCR